MRYRCHFSGIPVKGKWRQVQLFLPCLPERSWQIPLCSHPTLLHTGRTLPGGASSCHHCKQGLKNCLVLFLVLVLHTCHANLSWRHVELVVYLYNALLEWNSPCRSPLLERFRCARNRSNKNRIWIWNLNPTFFLSSGDRFDFIFGVKFSQCFRYIIPNCPG